MYAGGRFAHHNEPRARVHHQPDVINSQAVLEQRRQPREQVINRLAGLQRDNQCARRFGPRRAALRIFQLQVLPHRGRQQYRRRFQKADVVIREVTPGLLRHGEHAVVLAFNKKGRGPGSFVTLRGQCPCGFDVDAARVVLRAFGLALHAIGPRVGSFVDRTRLPCAFELRVVANAADQVRVGSRHEERSEVKRRAMPDVVRESRKDLLNAPPLTDQQREVEEQVPVLRG